MLRNCICGLLLDCPHNRQVPLGDTNLCVSADSRFSIRALGELLFPAMNTSLDLPGADSGAVETDLVVSEDRRISPRQDCHTLVTAVTSQHPDESDGWRVMKVHSEDVSVSGAKLISTHPLPGRDLYLRFLLPNFGKQFVEAKIVNQSMRKRVALTGGSTDLFVYGVKFVGVVSDVNIIRPLMTLTDASANG